MTDTEQRARDFLAYVEAHAGEIRRAVYKTMPLRGDAVDEILHDAVLKAHGAIMRGARVTDFPGYLFIACRSICTDRERAARVAGERADPLWLDIIDSESAPPLEATWQEEGAAVVRELLTMIAARFGAEIMGLWVLKKIGGYKWSFRNMARLSGVDQRKVSAMLRPVDRFVATDGNIRRLRRRLTAV